MVLFRKFFKILDIFIFKISIKYKRVKVKVFSLVIICIKERERNKNLLFFIVFFWMSCLLFIREMFLIFFYIESRLVFCKG